MAELQRHIKGSFDKCLCMLKTQQLLKLQMDKGVFECSAEKLYIVLCVSGLLGVGSLYVYSLHYVTDPISRECVQWGWFSLYCIFWLICCSCECR